jgi:hypothetical protein
MTTLLRSVRLLTIVLWEGGLLFFAFVLAPVAFHVLPSTHLAGLVVGGTLVILHWIGLLCGAIFLIATLILWSNRRIPRRHLYAVELVLVAVMLAITAYLQFSVVPAMERDRIQAGGDVDAAPADNPARLGFERLHPLSERYEGIALFAGLGIVFLLSAETHAPKAIDS